MENYNWLIYGILIGLFVPITLLLGNKQFGISSGFQNICSIVFPKTRKFFKGYDFNSEEWKVFFIIGILIGSFFAANIFSEEAIIIFPPFFFSIKGIIILFVGGFLVGFGSRYAKGCTSGHAIRGLSFLQLSSLVATISFFIGGLIYFWIIL